MPTLYFLVDTNLFIQCLPLEQLDWSPWDRFEEVRLIVTSPVLREVDHLKTKGNDRVGKRARAASAMFREMLHDAHKLVYAERPRVILSVEPQHAYDRSLEGRLNYRERDDQLLGTVYGFAQSNPSSDVRLLTHDTTPLYMAKSLNLTADLISDDWLLPPETTETAKRLTALEAENSRLRAAEPSFSVHCTNQSDAAVDCYSASYTWFEPLTDAEVNGLMQRLKVRFPLATDFGSREPAEGSMPWTVASRVFSGPQKFIPATDEEIEEYRNEAYPQWLKQCEEMLRTHHRTLQHETPALEFTFLAKNIGTRPATDALVTIEANGKFQLMPPSSDEEQEGDDDTRTNLEAKALPRPPKAPHGHWRNALGGQLGMDRLARSLKGLSGLADLDTNLINQPLAAAFPPIIRPISRDPNAFYYKPGRPSMPQNSFALECTQWRHDNEAEPFNGEILVPTDQDEAKGLLVCRIEAGNLSKSVSSQIPVRISMAHVRAFESARSMVEALTDD